MATALRAGAALRGVAASARHQSTTAPATQAATAVAVPATSIAALQSITDVRGRNSQMVTQQW